jgi:signal transduction histidine kinase
MLRHTRNEGVEILVTVPADLMVNGDETRWRQLLVNLMSNALKFTTKGQVHLSVEPNPETQQLYVEVCSVVYVEVSSVVYVEVCSVVYVSGCICLCSYTLRQVCDHGPGISAELLPRLFQKYAQGGFHKGSGLGLSIAQLIVRLMGADIKVESPYKDTGGGGAGAGAGACDITSDVTSYFASNF